MSNSNNNIDEIEQWLKPILIKEKLIEWTVRIEGNSSKGDGYASDIVFVNVRGTTSNNTEKEYNFVLKCAKRSEAFAAILRLREIVENELYMYDIVFSTFRALEHENNIDNPFDSIPKYYGQYTDDKTQVLVLENLKKIGFDLWDYKLPWPRENLIMNIKEYAKFHALSMAVKDQKPQVFQDFVSKLNDVTRSIFEATKMIPLVEDVIEESYQLLQGELDQEDLEKWRSVKKIIYTKYSDMYGPVGNVKVILHGDCWNNNFLVKLKDDKIATKVVKLDFQLARLSSPILDLSYFLFGCIAGEDIKVIDSILDEYYNSLAAYLTLLGSSADQLYTRAQFLEDWKIFSIFGTVGSILSIKIAHVDKNDLPDLVKATEDGVPFGEAFQIEVSDKSAFKNRIKNIIQYAVQNCVI